MANAPSKIALKILTILISIPVGRAMTKLIDRAWLAVRPNTIASGNPDDVTWKDTVSWAALSAAGIAVGQLITRRSAEGAYRALVGAPPPTAFRARRRRWSPRNWARPTRPPKRPTAPASAVAAAPALPPPAGA